MRSVQDRFWSDNWIRNINPLDRYLALYLLTNEHTNWCGLYELEIGMMAFETGLDREELQRSMLPRLSPKFIYVDGWVFIPNWTRHHMSESGTISPTQQKGIEAAWKGVPERIRLKIKGLQEEPYSDIPYTYPIGGVSPSSSSFSSTFASSEFEDETRKVYEADEDQPKKRSTAKYPHSKEVFSWFPFREVSWSTNITELKSAELLYLRGEGKVKSALAFLKKHEDDVYCPQVTKPSDLERKWNDIIKFADKND